MGLGSSIKKAAKSAGGAFKKAGKQVGSAAEKTYKEYDRYTSSDLGAYLTPYLSMYDSDGRQALRGAYGNYLSTGASAVNPAAGAAVGAGVAAFDAHNAPKPSGQAQVPAFTPPATQAVAQDDGKRAWMIAGGVVGAVLFVAVVVVVLRKKAG